MSPLTKKVIFGVFALVSGVVVMAIGLRLFVLASYYVPQSGMYPSLAVNSRLLVNRRAYRNPSEVRAGDIIAFHRIQGSLRYVYIWRVIGLPGDTVTTRGAQLILNGKVTPRKPLRDEERFHIFEEQIGSVRFPIAILKKPEQPIPDVSLTVAPNQFFVMGDNRLGAYDSRGTGTVSFSDIIGRKWPAD